MEDQGRAYSGVDNLSRSPDELLSRILSLLCTEDAVRTSVLSTRWRSMYSSTESEARGYDLELPAKVCLPSLKSVHLKNVGFSEDSWSKLFSNCPILEEFFSCSQGRGNSKLVISSPTLKRLTIDLNSGCFDVVVDSPSLVYLGCSIGYIKSLKLVNTQSLVEANIGIFRGGPEILSFIMGAHELMRGIRNIQKLRIGATILTGFKCLAIPIPMLHNMIRLTIYGWDYGLPILPYILEKCESLETLVLEDLCQWNCGIWNRADESSRISCLTSSLKTIKVGRFTGKEREVELVKYFLETAKVLELIEIHLDSEFKNPPEITTKLQMLPKNSEALMNIIV